MSKKKLPHIILIVLDSARAKSFSCYGYHRKTTPNIDRIAEEGVLYKWCFAPANWTLPSHASLFTGLYPSEHGCHWGFPFLDNALITLPQVLQQAGYFTVGISCNSLISNATGFTRGFDRFYDLGVAYPFQHAEAPSGFSVREKLASIISEPSPARVRWLVNRLVARAYGLVASWKAFLTRRALRLALTTLAMGQERHIFLFLNLMQVHGPYEPPRETLGTFGGRRKPSFRHLAPLPSQYYAIRPMPAEAAEKLTALYDEELLYVDRRIGELHQYLEMSGLADETVLIITSDHGELLGEHGGLFWHMYGLFQEQLHIPLIIRWPSELGAYGVNDNLAQLHDLFATLVGLCGSPFPVPEGSVDLLNGKRGFALAEDVDAPLRVGDWAARDPKFDAAAFPFREPAKVTIRLKDTGRLEVAVLQPQDSISLTSLAKGAMEWKRS